MVGAALLAFGGVVLAQSADPPQTPTGKIPDRYIVVLEDDVRDPGVVAREHAQRHGAEVSHVYRYALKGYAARIPAQGLEAVRSDPRIRFVSQDREVRASGTQTAPTGIRRIAASDGVTKDDGNVKQTLSNDGAGVNVAVIDTGIDIHNPGELGVVGGKNCQTGTSYDDGNGHGSHVAGTIAAKEDDDGVVGVAPAAKLYAVRVLNNAGSGSWSTVVCGIDWATSTRVNPDGTPESDPNNDIHVANMSLGGGGSDGSCGADALHLAICNSVAADVAYVVAAGNDTKDLNGFVPAAYNEVLTVTAVADFNGKPGGGAAATCRSDVDDTAANFSNFTTVGHDDVGHTIAAPGVCIRSTWKDGSYKTISGTSMASPHVAGTAALCIASGIADRCTSPADVTTDLRADAAEQPSTYGFAEDPHRVTTSGKRYYGYLEYAGGY